MLLVNILENKDSTEIKQLTDKYNLSNKKICNYRNQIMQLKNDLKTTQNVRTVLNEHLICKQYWFNVGPQYRHYLMKSEIQQ